MCSNTNLFLELLKPEYNDALKYCRALCSKRSADDAEDVLQQSLLKALEYFDNLQDTAKFRSWFFKIITREFLNSVRKDFWKRFLPADGNKFIPEMPEVFEETEDSERKLLLYRALSRISPKEKTALLLFEIGDFSIEDIAQIQGEKSISAVKSRLSRVRAKLKKLIESEEKKSFISNNNSLTNIGDLENETINLIREIEAK